MNKEYKVGDEVTVKTLVRDGGEAPSDTIGKQGIIKVDDEVPKRRFKVCFEDPSDYWWYSTEELELAKKPMLFKVGEAIKVIDASGSYKAVLGDIVTIVKVGGINGDLISVKAKDGTEYNMYDNRFQKVIEETMTLKEAQKACIDGAKVTLENVMHPKSHMLFTGTKFMWSFKGELQELDGILGYDRWKIWTEPPKFTKDSLVYNTDGTIGRIVSDNGIHKGVRRYSVKFNAVRDALKSVEESELTEYA